MSDGLIVSGSMGTATRLRTRCAAGVGWSVMFYADMYGSSRLYVKPGFECIDLVRETMNFEEVTFAILAGGHGFRLGGCVKGLLEVDGRPIIDWLLTAAAPFAARLLVTDDARPYAAYGLPTVRDVEPGYGAPGGVVTALQSATTPWVLVVGCDMPFVTEGMMLRLIELTAAACDVACFTRKNQFEPLFALYRQSLGSRWRSRLGDRSSLRSLLASVRVAHEAVSDEQRLDSLNTVADLQRHRVVRKF